MTAILKYPYDLETNDMYKHTVSFKNKRHRHQTSVPANGGSVHLYLPADALKTSYSQSYADTDLGAVGNVINTMDEKTVNAAGEAISSGSLSRMMGVLKGVGADDATKTALKNAAAREATKKAAGAIGEGATAAIQKRLGQIVNPFKAVIYQGPGGFRTFSFTFVMQPESDTEVQTVKDIVYFFKYHMHPGVSNLSYTTETGRTSSAAAGGYTNIERETKTTAGNLSSSAMLTYPDTFEISLNPNMQKQGDTNVSKNALFRIENCFLESFNVDYTTSGGAAFFDDTEGSPVTTTIAMQFKETQLMTRNKIAQGY